MTARLPFLAKAFTAARERVENLPPVRKITGDPLGNRFLKETEFRAEVFLYTGFGMNLLYCVMQVVLGVFYRSLWAGALAVFHFLLASMRFQLLNTQIGRRSRQIAAAQWRKYRACGIILLCMTPFFASVLILVVHKNSGGRYAGSIIYLMAIYTFFVGISSLVNVVRFRKSSSPVLSAAMLVKLTAALMSVLSLETAMLTRFDRSEDFVFRQGVTGTTGGAVCLFALGISIYMVVQGTNHIKEQRMK